MQRRNQQTVANLVVASKCASRHRLSVRIRRGELVRIHHGYYLETAYLMSLKHPWEQAEAVAVARIVACSQTRRNGVIIGLASAVLHGLAYFGSLDRIDIAFAPRKGSLRHVDLEEVWVNGRRIAPPGRLVIHRSKYVNRCCTIHGVRVLELDQAIISTALLNPVEVGFVTMCEGMARLSNYSRHTMDVSRIETEQVRKMLGECLDSTEVLPGKCRRARWVISHADSACESVAEERLLCILRRSGVQGTQTQYLVGHPSGKYYLDIGIPELLLAIEVDGMVKYRDRNALGQVLFDEQQRELNLRRMGWCVVRFRWHELDDPDQVVRKISEEVQYFGRELRIDPNRGFSA